MTFFGNTYATTGTYYHYGTTPEGCDSTSVLQLIVHQLVDTTVTVCSTELPYLWINKWDGSITPLYAAGTYRNDTTFYNGERMSDEVWEFLDEFRARKGHLQGPSDPTLSTVLVIDEA